MKDKKKLWARVRALVWQRRQDGLEVWQIAADDEIAPLVMFLRGPVRDQADCRETIRKILRERESDGRRRALSTLQLALPGLEEEPIDRFRRLYRTRIELSKSERINVLRSYGRQAIGMYGNLDAKTMPESLQQEVVSTIGSVTKKAIESIEDDKTEENGGGAV